MNDGEKKETKGLLTGNVKSQDNIEEVLECLILNEGKGGVGKDELTSSTSRVQNEEEGVAEPEEGEHLRVDEASRVVEITNDLCHAPGDDHGG